MTDVRRTPSPPREGRDIRSPDLRQLRERVAGLTGPDRIVDGELYSGLGLLRQYEEVYPRNSDYCLRYYPGPPGPDYFPLPRLTASIDAALALVKRCRPKDETYGELHGPYRYLHIPSPIPNHWSFAFFDGTRGWGPTAPLAILDALLKALIAQEQPDD